MSRRSISDDSGRFNFEVEVHGTVLEDAIDHNNAEEVLKCALILALSVLAQDGPWPTAALESMSDLHDRHAHVAHRRAPLTRLNRPRSSPHLPRQGREVTFDPTFQPHGGDLGSTEVVKLQLRVTGTWGPPKPRLRKLNADNTFALAA